MRDRGVANNVLLCERNAVTTQCLAKKVLAQSR
jgi:hypothetical protein